VAWLISHGKCGYKGEPTLSIRDLFKPAVAIQEKAVKLLEILHFLFREAIAARKQLSNFFRDVDFGDDRRRPTTNNSPKGTKSMVYLST